MKGVCTVLSRKEVSLLMPIPKKKEHVQQKSAKTIVYEALRDWIVDGTLQPGEKILVFTFTPYLVPLYFELSPKLLPGIRSAAATISTSSHFR